MPSDDARLFGEVDLPVVELPLTADEREGTRTDFFDADFFDADFLDADFLAEPCRAAGFPAAFAVDRFVAGFFRAVFFLPDFLTAITPPVSDATNGKH